MAQYSLAWRPRKRAVQSELTDRIKQVRGFNHKKVITLCGPDIDGAVGIYEMHDLHKNGIILAEIDRTQICRAILHSSKKNIGNCKYVLKDNKKAQIIHGDVFNIANKYKGKISGFDYDFCTSLNDDKIRKIYASVKDSGVDDAWVRVTTCHRRINREHMTEMLAYMRKQFHEEFDEVDCITRGYRDKVSPAMNVWQIILRRKKMKERKNLKKMRDLKEKDKEMLRALVEYKFIHQNVAPFNERDIANLFNVSKETISAVKAVNTMKSREERLFG